MNPIPADKILKEIYKVYEEDILFTDFGSRSAIIIKQKNEKFGISVQNIMNKYLLSDAINKIRAEIEREEKTKNE